MSHTEGESSPARVEGSMSPADDVVEMQGFCTEIADLLRLPQNLKDRTNELQRLFGRQLFGWNRINEFLRGKARRVDGWEKDHARRILEQQREADLRAQADRHVDWLRSTVEHLQASGEELDGFNLAGLERALARAGASGRPVGRPGAAEFDADFDQRNRWD